MAVHRTLALCRRLKHLRDNQGFTQQHVAKYLGVSQAAYSRLEKGEIELGFSKLVSLSDLYGLPITKMLADI